MDSCGTAYWKCLKYKAKSGLCPGRILTMVDEIVENNAIGRNHAGDAASVETREIRGNIRKRSRNSRDTPKFILAKNLASVILQYGDKVEQDDVQGYLRGIANNLNY